MNKCQCGYENKENFNFCPECGTMLSKPSTLNIAGTKKNRPGRTSVDEAFDRLGLDEKLMKEQGITKSSILGDLRQGVKPADEVAIRKSNEIGEFFRP